MNKVYLKVTKEQIEQTLGYELEYFSLHPEYVLGECIGLEIHAIPKEKIIQIPINAFIEKER
jgi:hypothetical protein